MLWTNLLSAILYSKTDLSTTKRAFFIASRQLVSSKQELHSTDLEWGRDSLL